MAFRIYPLKYNPYSNKVVKSFSTLSAYLAYSVFTSQDKYYSVNNLDIRNGLQTTITVRTDLHPITNQPDYCLITDDNGNSMMRWFVVGFDNVREGHQEWALRRDVLAECWGSILTSPYFFCRRGFIDSLSDVSTVSNEGFNTTQKLWKRAPINGGIYFPSQITNTHGAQEMWTVIYIAKWTQGDQTQRDHDANYGYLKSYTTQDQHGLSLNRALLADCKNSTCNIVVIPPRGYPIKLGNNWYNTQKGEFDPIETAAKIAQEGGLGAEGQFVYDIQYLPYPPGVFNVNISSSDRNYDSRGSESYFSITNYSSSKKGLVIGADAIAGVDYRMFETPNGTPDSQKNIALVAREPFFNSYCSFFDDYVSLIGDTVKSRHIDANMNFVRLVSQNHTNMFDFNVAINNIGRRRVTEDPNNGIDCTLYVKMMARPQNTFLMVCPNYREAGLYGNSARELEDRGLICSGDFSLPSNSSAWIQFTNQNRTFESVFRKNYKISLLSLGAQTLLGGLGGFGSGAGAGVQAGMTTGSPEIGIAAGLLSTGAGAFDTIVNSGLQYMELQKQKIAFEGGLTNLKARAEGIVSTGSLNNITSPVPYLEIWTSDDNEVQALTNFIETYALKIERYVKIQDLVHGSGTPVFCQGDLIRFEIPAAVRYGSNEMIEEIKRLLSEGVFI